MAEDLNEDVSLKQEVLLKTMNYLSKMENLNNCGKIVEGTVKRIDKKAGFVAMHVDGLKSDGIISIREFSKDERSNLQVGDKKTVKLISLTSSKGHPIVSRAEIVRKEALESLQAKFQLPEGERVTTGTAIAKLGKAWAIDLPGGVIGILPANQVDLKTASEVDFLGSVQNFKILKIEGENVILSKKFVLNEEQIQERNTFLENAKEGDIVRGAVQSIFPYGVFIDIHQVNTASGEISFSNSPSLCGFCYLTDVAWVRPGDLSEILSVGQIIDAKILKIKSEDQGKIALSIKELTPNPRAELIQHCKEGDQVEAIVKEITEHGICVTFTIPGKLTQNYDGFVHLTEFAWFKEDQNTNGVKVGDKIQAKIIDLDTEKKKIPLSIKSLKESPVKVYCGQLKEGETLHLEIARVLAYGLILILADKIEILLHVKEMFWVVCNYEYFLKKYNIGDKIEVKYLGYCDNLNRAKITTKDIGNNVDPNTYLKTLKQNDSISVEIVEIRLPDRGVYVLYMNTLHCIEYTELPKNTSSLKVGDIIQVKVIGFKDTPSISNDHMYSFPIFSLREIQNDENRKIKEKYSSNNQGGSSLGDILGFALDKAITEKSSGSDKEQE